MSDIERSPSFLPAQETSPVQLERVAESEQYIAQPEPKVAQEFAVVPALPAVQPAQSVPLANDPRTGVLKQVESLLAEGLMQLYQSLPEARRAEFKRRGEEVANKITDMIIFGKEKVKEIWKLIGEWLRMVSGVNKYYLEQEIKIKTDRIMMFAQSEHA